MSAEGGPRPVDRLYLLSVFVVAVGVFAYTSPPTVAFEDDGDFVMAADLLGVAHPPGYPLFVLLAKPFTWLPLGEVAWRVHVASGCFGALAAVVLWWIVRRLTGSPGIALAASLALAFGETFWSQAIVAEVYTLNALIFLALVALALAYAGDPRPRRAAAMGLVFGLGLCNHWPLLLLATPGLALLLWPQRSALVRAIPHVVPAIAIGLLPYAWMWIRANQDPALNFFGPFETPREFARFVARRVYAGVEADTTSSWWDKVEFARFFGLEWIRQYTPIGALLALFGLVDGLRRRPASWNLGLALAFISPSILLLLLLDVPFDFRWRSTVRVYPLICYAVGAIWLGGGLAWLERRLPVRVPLGAGAWVGLALTGVLFVRGWSINDRHDFELAREAAATLLEVLPEDAILVTDVGFETFTMGYLHLVEGSRPDVSLYHQQGVVFGDRLFRFDAGQSEKERILHALVRESRRPVFFTDRDIFRYGRDDYGYYASLHADRPRDATNPVIASALVGLTRRFAAHLRDADPWTRFYSQLKVFSYASFLTAVLHRDSATSLERAIYEPELEALCSTPHGLVGHLLALADLEGQDPAQLLELALGLERRLDPRDIGLHVANVHLLVGRLLERLERWDEAGDRYRRALAVDPRPPLATALRLLGIYARKGDREAYQKLRARYIHGPEVWERVSELDRELERNSR